MWTSFLDSLIFLPSRGALLRPEAIDWPVEEVWLHSEDAVRIHGYWLPSEQGERAILFLHGNAGEASMRLPFAAALARLGASVLALDYRGYGKSQGRPSEAGVYRDARAGLSHIMLERGLPERRIVLFGRSLGGAVAVEAARGRELAGVVLESTFSSVNEIARQSMGFGLGPLLWGRLASDRKIGELRCPLLFFHGDADSVIPIELGRALYERAPEPKRFHVIPGADHDDVYLVGGRAYFELWRSFLEEVAPLT